MIKLLNTQTKSIVTAATIVAAFSFISRFVGFIRDRILAGRFGAGDTLDAYYAAFLIPDLLFNLLVIGALSASFIPLFTECYQKTKGEQEAWNLTNNVINILAAIFLCLSVIVFFLAPFLTHLIAPSFSSDKQDLVTQFTRIMLISDFLLALSAVYGSVLQGLKRFFLYSLSPLFYNIGIITGAELFVPRFGPSGLAWGVVLGAALHCSIQLIGVIGSGYRYRWVMEWKDTATRKMAKLMIPRTMGVAVAQLSAAGLVVLAGTLTSGSVTVYQFAYNIQFFAVGIIGVSFAVAAFPAFSEAAAKKDTTAFVGEFSHTARQMLFFLLPATVLFLLLRAQIVRVVVGAGEFGWDETIATANTLAFFTLSFCAQSLVYLLARAFYALQDTARPFVVGMFSGLLTIISAYVLSKSFGVTGLAMGFSLASVMQMVLMWILLRRKIGSLNEWGLASSLLRMVISTIAAGSVMQAMKPLVTTHIPLDTFFGVLFQGLLAGGAGLVVYGVTAWLLKSPEMISFVSAMRRKFFKQYQPTEIISPE